MKKLTLWRHAVMKRSVNHESLSYKCRSSKEWQVTNKNVTEREKNKYGISTLPSWFWKNHYKNKHLKYWNVQYEMHKYQKCQMSMSNTSLKGYLSWWNQKNKLCDRSDVCNGAIISYGFQFNLSNESIFTRIYVNDHCQWPYRSVWIIVLHKHNITNTLIVSRDVPFLTALKRVNIFLWPFRPKFFTQTLNQFPLMSDHVLCIEVR